MKTHIRYILAMAVAVVCVGVTSTGLASMSITGLGDLPGGVTNSLNAGVSGDGSTAVGNSKSAASTGVEAYRWTQSSGMAGLGDFPGGSFNSYGEGVSGDGSTVVGYGNSTSGNEAYRWTQSGGMAGLGDLPEGVFPALEEMFPAMDQRWWDTVLPPMDGKRFFGRNPEVWWG